MTWRALAALTFTAALTVTPPASAAPQIGPPPPGFPDLSAMADVSGDHTVSTVYPLATFTSPTGLQCAMWSSLGDTAASCYGPLPGQRSADRAANWAYANDREAHLQRADQPPAPDKLGGRLLRSGEKVVLGAGGTLMQGDQITCAVMDETVACVLVNGFSENKGGPNAPRTGFVLDPVASWTF